ncbi:hypothetical protein BGW38_003301, partial [Lunasporangiospora selenospora]
VRDLRRPKGSERISNRISSASRKPQLPQGTKLLKARAIGSTDAIQQGARVDDVVVHGNWSSSVLFDKLYRLNAATAANFTSMVLS